MFGIEPSEEYRKVSWKTWPETGESYDLRAEARRQTEHCLGQVLCFIHNVQSTRYRDFSSEVHICPGLIVKAKACGRNEQHCLFITTGMVQLK